jgi:RNA polymerase sigma factor (sigma-70 family)
MILRLAGIAVGKAFFIAPLQLCEIFPALHLTGRIFLNFQLVKQEPLAHISDQQLLERFYITRDNQLLGVLLQRYTLLLLGVCMKYLKNEEEARDSVQQVFLKVITELHKYRVEYFKSWLYMVAKNHCLMKLRDRPGRIAGEVQEQMVAVTPEENDSIRLHMEKDRQLELMNDCLQELNTDQKRCVTLFYLEKKSYAEISSQTGYTLMQVKSYIQNGKRNLKILLEKKLNQ